MGSIHKDLGMFIEIDIERAKELRLVCRKCYAVGHKGTDCPFNKGKALFCMISGGKHHPRDCYRAKKDRAVEDGEETEQVEETPQSTTPAAPACARPATTVTRMRERPCCSGRRGSTTWENLRLMLLVLKITAAIDVGLALLVKLLDKWLDYSDFKFSLNTNKIKDICLFMDEASRLRENLGFPAKSFAPFSQDIDIKPADRCQLLASISGLAMAYNTPLIITGPSSINIGHPDRVLDDILGRRYDTEKKNNPFSKAVELD